MKNIFVILCFHAHELIWDLPEILLSYLEEGNPMQESLLEENYLKKRKEEERDIYWHCSDFGDSLGAPLCVEYTNELLFQIKDVLPKTYDKIKKDYQRGRLYPLYGHAHHTHIALLQSEDLAQEIVWNMQFLHNLMGVPYPKYKGVFPTEASLDYRKIHGIKKANINYVIFPHLRKEKVPFGVDGEEDYTYKPFLIQKRDYNLLAFPRNFMISQEIWRPITKMKRDEVKFQGYMLGKFPVFYNEYLHNELESFPISFEEGVEIYKEVLRTELKKTPDNGVLVYIQDLELMDFGDLALDIMEKAWKDILEEEKGNNKIHFVTPDQYIDEVLKKEDISRLPRIKFDQICWAPEIRLILRTDGHYPPIGVTGVGRYDIEKTGTYYKPLIFWENGKYFCNIFETLMSNLNISRDIFVSAEKLVEIGYRLGEFDLFTQAVLYMRLIKRACNWGWRPTEGRQKRPCLKGYLLCTVLLRILEDYPDQLVLTTKPKEIDTRNLVGIIEVLKAFIDSRVNYLKYGMEKLGAEKEINLKEAYQQIEEVLIWKEKAIKAVKEMYIAINENNISLKAKLIEVIKGMQGYCQSLYMATDHIQYIWSAAGHTDFLVEKMYEYLYDLYPPIFPEMVNHIDFMTVEEVKNYFENKKL